MGNLLQKIQTRFFLKRRNLQEPNTTPEFALVPKQAKKLSRIRHKSIAFGYRTDRNSDWKAFTGHSHLA